MGVFVAEERKRYTIYPPPHPSAHGLCFSVQKPVPPPPRVLLLNAVLTVRAHNANSHKDRVWEKFTPSVISWLNKNLNGVVFMLWGAYAQKKGSNIDRKRHHVLQTVHPLPLSVHRGFYGCRHFSKTNVYLKDTGRELIDWKAL
uniref:Uracil-DNA glycosylase-like domain-containing protein n=1 Tax=Leptobrachium leishanense TaxID=445787 RepID=A0A8C5LP23_9ANUR